jgi:hypothetical protein
MFLEQLSEADVTLPNLTNMIHRSGLDLDPNIHGRVASVVQLVIIFIAAMIVDRIWWRDF